MSKGRPVCPYRERARQAGVPRYLDASFVERWTSSGNSVSAKRKWETSKRRARGVQPPVLKATPETIAAKNRANVKRWKAENPDKLRVLRARGNFVRRSAVRGRILEPVTVEFLTVQRAMQNDCCAYCTNPLFGAGHQDHVVPVSKGGAHAPFNIVWACEPCNLRKGAKLGWVPFWMRK
jgi:5-methylcytosine-specific restriction endonuclease McrA